MCGIAGLVAKTKIADADKQKFISSSRLMSHRGPDHFGVFADDKVLLIHFRLSIIDLDPRSHQPFQLEAPDATIVYNGELYNFRELKKRHGIQTVTESDTEVLLRTFIDYDVRAVEEWNGIFAAAIYRSDTGELTLLRDRFGVKPLYIYEGENYFAFASEAKVLLDWLPSFSLRDEGFVQYLWYGNCNDNGTIVSQIDKFPAAHLLTFSVPEFRQKRKLPFWKIPATRTGQLHEEDIVAELRELLAKAVRRQLISDVPLGIFLSGGIDSSTLVAFASSATKKIDAYTVTYDYHIGGQSELAKARLTASHFGADLHEVIITAPNIIDDIQDMAFQYDEPFSDQACLPLYQLSRVCSRDKKVILQGDGGDEIFAGYRRYNILNHAALWKYFSGCASLIPSPYRERMRRLNHLLKQNSPGKLMALFLTQETPFNNPLSILNDTLSQRLRQCDPFEAYGLKAEEFAGENPVQKMIFTDVSIELQHTFLEKVDKATMKCSIESRVPFLDNDLTDFALSLPSGFKVRSGQKKYLLRKAMRGILPDAILDGPKRGFDVPYAYWLRNELQGFARAIFEDKQIEPYFNRSRLLSLLSEHQKGSGQHAPILWKAMVFALWMMRHKSKLLPEA
jgi:asparagine synthase (glutamine-hydrolysing)